MKIYRGEVVDGHEQVTVAQWIPSMGEPDPQPLRHHVLHSPDGFAWGYAGSGPSELARCILIDHFGHHDDPDLVDPALYQAFKTAFVTPVPRGERWALRSVDIDKWLAAVTPQAIR